VKVIRVTRKPLHTLLKGGSAAMSGFDDRPWTAQYTERLREVELGARTTLELLADAVANAPQGPAIIYLGGTLTYREVDELTDGVAHYLLESGFRPGDRLALYLQNVPQFVLVQCLEGGRRGRTA
jgi:long-chain acyl-CoA synthetase